METSPDPTAFCVLDIETTGGLWESFPKGFELLLTGVRRGDEYFAFTSEPASLAQMADFFESFSGVTVTFNGSGFDLPLLQDYTSRFLQRPLSIAQHFDIMRELEMKAGYRISLDNVSKYTFGKTKLAWDHRQNRRVWSEQPHLLVAYNRRDLDLTHELYQRVLNGQPLFLGDNTVVLSPPHRPSAAP